MGGGEDRYDLEELIGAGGMAEVYRAKMVGAVGFEKQVAIKRLLPHVSSDQEFVQRFIDEARLTARLVHPNICQILDFGVMDECYFITMEYVDGLDLSALLKGAERENERIPVDVALSVICGVLRGLKHAHEATDEEGHPLGIVHRDVSPQNVLLSVNGDVKLSDLGAATANEAYRSTRTQKHFRLGKVLYMAPEQRRQKNVDARADLYSTGILLAEMLLGQGEFHQDANMFLAGMCCLWEKVEARLASPLGEGLSRVIERALAEDPSRRFQTADEMLTSIESLLVEYAPGTSVDRVARLVQRLKKRSKGRKKDGLDTPETSRSFSSVVSLHTGDVQPFDEADDEPLPDRQFPDEVAPDPEEGLTEAITTIAHSARGSRATPTDLDAPVIDSKESEYDFENVATQIHRGAAHRARPTPIPQEYESAPQRSTPIGPDAESSDALPSVVVEDEDTLFEEQTRREASPLGETAAHERRRSRRPLLIGVIVVGLVLIAGLGFGGLLANELFPAGNDVAPSSSGGHTVDDLISTTPSTPQVPQTPGASSPPTGAPPERAAIGQVLDPPPSAGSSADSGPPSADSRVEETDDEEARDAHRVREQERAEARRERRRERRERGERSERPSDERSTASHGHGFLNINSRPYGIPYVDGVPIPSGTPVARYRVSAGTHRVVVRFPQNDRTAERVVRVEDGQTRGVTLTLND